MDMEMREIERMGKKTTKMNVSGKKIINCSWCMFYLKHDCDYKQTYFVEKNKE